MSSVRSFKLALIFGGPSRERGISLNSARSVTDHLQSFDLEIIPVYVDCRKRFYRVSHAHLYSNTPADFDFKVGDSGDLLDPDVLEALLKSVDLVFPVIHGHFGEDGELQALLEKMNVPFVGHASKSCKKMFDKSAVNRILKESGFPVLPQAVLFSGEADLRTRIETFFNMHCPGRAIVKPAFGGSSIGVSLVRSSKEAYRDIRELLDDESTSCAVIEPFCTGKEFTVIVFESRSGRPVALVPTEIELTDSENAIFDFRKKYLPTDRAVHRTPPRFSSETIDRIRTEAEELFGLFEMRDVVRIDGRCMPGGTLYFMDINPISGMEQNSFLFRQASLVGLSHRDALEYIVKSACKRYGLTFPDRVFSEAPDKKPVHVLFGNNNAERQVSLMSGTNVWLKLLRSSRYSPEPFFLDEKKNVWKLPYSYTLNHTVEEIYENCLSPSGRSDYERSLFARIRRGLEIEAEDSPIPTVMSLESFFLHSRSEKAFVFIALHGGEGENGQIQKRLEELDVPFNGSGPEASALCMDKYLTGKRISSLRDPDLISLPKERIDPASLAGCSADELQCLWNRWCERLDSDRLIVKPLSDGCSAGIALLRSCEDLCIYLDFFTRKAAFIPPFTFPDQISPIEMPTGLTLSLIVEPYIETDIISIEKGRLHHARKEGWIELTTGVTEKSGIYHAYNPSIAVAEGSVLTLEEKFQGGTGVNLTPPPEEIISSPAIQKIKRVAEKAAAALGIQNYARIDLFFNRITEKTVLIEANTLPGLTPSTVLYHQALAEPVSLIPSEFLDAVISSKSDFTCRR